MVSESWAVRRGELGSMTKDACALVVHNACGCEKAWDLVERIFSHFVHVITRKMWDGIKK